ncbi:MAG TPA: alpha-isopropylmalate synthase regulatory domain-containing protein, partial [Savagea sp.]
HCHDDLGLAVANSIAAVENGAEQVEGTINGIGERAGNAALEEIAVAMHIRGDFYQTETGIHLKETKKLSQMVSRLTGVVIQPNKAVVGRNAFAHESGIHQDGMLKNRETYEIITPELIGAKDEPLALGKHSGRHAFKDRAVSMGFELNDEQLNAAFAKFKDLADRKKEITEDDLFVLFTNQQTKNTDLPMYQLQQTRVEYKDNKPVATITALTPEGETVTVESSGGGSVEAIFNTLEKLVDGEVHILDYRVTSVGKGRDALGEAVINLSVDDEKVTGRDVAQDVLQASAKAYINAINRRIMRKHMKRQQAAMAE